ncbi:dTDP-glucose 4,6-dehydratase [Hugenholtzia roseola]|uniref:dTDP-glucose 4,6-dehydratase n=1 Tax=Hugenholtzia roseola TaxID=1002 RepID=UPI00041DAB77|nr:dTDP-glucose 4,6-dehydratase [Hugenholtzia roseola]
MKHILITGGAGFIGSNFLPYFLNRYPDYRLLNLDLLTYAGNLDNLKEIENEQRYEFIKGDICNRGLLSYLFTKYDIRGVIHFAAESHVDNSISGPEAFVRTNVEGTFSLLETARKHWFEAPFQAKAGYQDCRFLHVSTDEVYGSLGDTGFFTENTPYAPNSPYSASKAASDMLVRSYYHTFGLNVVTTNCSNNFGFKQHQEKLIPTIIRKALNAEPIPIYGDGKNVRDWLFVLDHCTAIDAVFHKGRTGETYNVGTRNERNNLELCYKICEILDQHLPKPDTKYAQLIAFVKDRPGHDKRYAIDPTKLETELGWKAATNFEHDLTQTVIWYIKHFTGKEIATPAFEAKSNQTENQTESQVENQTENQTKTQTANSQNAPIEDIPESVIKEEKLKKEPIAPPPAEEIPPQEQPIYGAPNSEATKYQGYLNLVNLEEAIDALAEVKASLIRVRKDYEAAQEKEKDCDTKARQIIGAAQEGKIEWEQANKLAMELLKKQEQAKVLADQHLHHLAQLGGLQAQMEDRIAQLRTIRKQHTVKMPDSSDTINMIERMKAKISKNEILADLYKEKPLQDPELDKKVNEALGVNPEKEALEALKKQLGMK